MDELRGSKRERSPGVYELRVYTGRDPVTGRDRQKSVTFHGGARAADRKLAQLVTEVGQPTTAATMAQLLERWLELAARDRSPTTVTEYRRLVARRIVPAIGDIPLAKLTAVHLDRFYLGLSGDLSPASIRRVHAVVRRALGQAVRWGWVGVNVAAAASPPAVPKSRITVPTVDEVRTLIEAAEGISPEFGAMIRVAAGTGMRRGELCGLAWDRVDLKRGVVKVERAVVEANGVPHVKGTKSGRERSVTVSGGTLAALHAQQDRMAVAARTAGVRAGGWVWSSEPDGSRYWLPGTVSSRWERARSSVGLQSVRLHDLRHAHVTVLLDKGVPVETVAARVGHSSTAMTWDVYGHAVDGRDAEAAGIIDGLYD